MPINMAAETIFPLAQLPDRYPLAGKGGKKLHRATAFRWAQRGVRGVRLETARVGGTLYTSNEAVERFVERLSADPSDRPATAAPSGPSPARQRDLDRANRELDRLGV
jgi:hypothetical protein